MLVTRKFTSITSVWQWSPANCFGVGGSFYWSLENLLISCNH